MTTIIGAYLVIAFVIFVAVLIVNRESLMAEITKSLLEETRVTTLLYAVITAFGFPYAYRQLFAVITENGNVLFDKWTKKQ